MSNSSEALAASTEARALALLALNPQNKVHYEVNAFNCGLRIGVKRGTRPGRIGKGQGFRCRVPAAVVRVQS